MLQSPRLAEQAPEFARELALQNRNRHCRLRKDTPALFQANNRTPLASGGGGPASGGGTSALLITIDIRTLADRHTYNKDGKICIKGVYQTYER